MKKYLLAPVAAVAFAGSAQAATTVGTANIDNCIPFGCASFFNTSTYQQVYAAGAFAGPTMIDTISFTRNPVPGPGTLSNADFEISFYLTSAAVNGLSTTGADNLGTLLANFSSFSLDGSAAPDLLSFSGSAFTYDPTAGNLLMQVIITNIGPNGPNAFYDADSSGSVTSRYYAANGEATGLVGAIGLVTTFDFVGAGAVPEPATWAFMIFGFGAIGTAMRRQRKAKVKVSYA